MNKLLFILTLCSIFCFGQRMSSAEIALINSGEKSQPLPVFQTDNPVQHATLLKTSTDVKPRNRHTQKLAARMKASLLATEGGVGIAAPQVGINRNMVWVQRFDKPGRPLECFLNPVVIWRSEVLNLGPEGDLSIAAYRAEFYRSQVIRVIYQNLQGKRHDEMMEGFTAIIAQHEIDHLKGLLIPDREKTQSQKTFEMIPMYREVRTELNN